jgi:predicted nucleic acid-binding protein
VWAYFDSSAVVKVYVQESGRAAVLRLLHQHEVVASAILPVEIRGALRRRAAENVIESSHLPSALQQFAKDRTQWNLLAVSTEILERGEQIVASHTVEHWTLSTSRQPRSLPSGYKHVCRSSAPTTGRLQPPLRPD